MSKWSFSTKCVRGRTLPSYAKTKTLKEGSSRAARRVFLFAGRGHGGGLRAASARCAAPCARAVRAGPGKDAFLVTFEGVDSIDIAELLVGCSCLVRRADLPESALAAEADGLEGFEVHDARAGFVGVVESVVENPGQYLLERRARRRGQARARAACGRAGRRFGRGRAPHRRRLAGRPAGPVAGLAALAPAPERTRP